MRRLRRAVGEAWTHKLAAAPPEDIAFGASYYSYSEHWPEERWPEDIRLMREAGIGGVRLAELAWSFLEPQEGRFEFGWLDRFLGLAQRFGIRAVLGTPGEASPGWLRKRYPEAVRTGETGTLRGGRGMHCQIESLPDRLSNTIEWQGGAAK